MSDLTFTLIGNGLANTQAVLATLAGNLANTATAGYAQVYTQTWNQAASPERPPNTVLQDTTLGPGTLLGSGTSLTPSTLTWSPATESSPIPTNLAIQGAGFFAVTTPAGTPAYTRNGAFTLNAQGHWVLPNGSRLVGLAPVPTGWTPQVAPDGTVTATSPTGRSRVLGTIRVALFANASGLQATGGETLYEPSADSGPAQMGTPALGGRGTLVTGALDASAATVTATLPALLAAQSAYTAGTDALKAEQAVAQTTDTLRI